MPTPTVCHFDRKCRWQVVPQPDAHRRRGGTGQRQLRAAWTSVEQPVREHDRHRERRRCAGRSGRVANVTTAAPPRRPGRTSRRRPAGRASTGTRTPAGALRRSRAGSRRLPADQDEQPQQDVESSSEAPARTPTFTRGSTRPANECHADVSREHGGWGLFTHTAVRRDRLGRRAGAPPPAPACGQAATAAAPKRSLSEVATRKAARRCKSSPGVQPGSGLRPCSRSFWSQRICRE